jgi:hypothetical protein
MTNFVLQIWEDELQKVTYYSFIADTDEDSITTKFFKSLDQSGHADALNDLISLLINKIGNEYGATKAIFSRDEHLVAALPPRGNLVGLGISYPNFPFRLHAYRLSDELVILFSGGPKESGKTQDSPKLNQQWQLAQKLAKQLDDFLLHKELLVRGREIVTADGGPLEELIFYIK